MSGLGLGFDDGGAAPAPEPRRRRGSRRRRPRRGLLALLVAVVVLGLVAWFGGSWAYHKLEDALAGPADYPGPGTGSVVVEVEQGATAAVIGRTLKDAGVVESVEAFTDAARSDDRSRGIQVGFYELRKQMKAADALAVLVDPDNLVQAKVTIPEGSRVGDVIAAIAKNTDFTGKQVRQALAKTDQLGLPPEAEGNPEGYLYPATYVVSPRMTVLELLQQMVAKTKAVEEDLDIAAGAERLGYSVEQIMTMASILEYEGLLDEDLPKIARVFYNRLAAGQALQSDATVAYANKLEGTVWTTAEQRANPSAYNTYVHTGLPPGPIGSPGERTIRAALEPADGDWMFFVPINLETGETAFATTFAEHQQNVSKLRAWCAKTDSPNCD